MRKDDDDDNVIGALFNVLSSKLGATTSLLIILIMLGMFVLRTSENYGPLARPFLVGYWESTTRLENNAWVRQPRPTVLTLYDDGVASLDGLKGSWAFADISRSAIRIEIPGRDKVSPSKLYELRVRLGDPLWGTMKESDKMLKFEQLEQGGAVGAIVEGVEAAIQQERRKVQELAEKACQETGWKKVAYRIRYFLRAEEDLDCSRVQRKQSLQMGQRDE